MEQEAQKYGILHKEKRTIRGTFYKLAVLTEKF